MATRSDQSDTYYMKAALDLAAAGLGRVAPNPSVGCVLVKDGQIIAAARTQDGGRPHAETAALDQVGGLARNCEAFVTLEPCFHEDRPSCSSALIAAGVRRVVIGCLDENPAITGKGVAALTKAGIEVVVGCLEENCHTLNQGFFLSKNDHRPLITLKIAVSLDSKIATATGQSQWITGPQSRARVHLERSRHDAILTGINTVLMDDPMLTTRVEGLEHKSRRVILDTHLKFPVNARMLEANYAREIIVFTSENADRKNQALLEEKGIRLIASPSSPDGKIPLDFVLNTLAKEGVTRLMVEGGQSVLTSFLAADLWDDLLVFRAPVLIGADGRDAFGPLGTQALTEAARLECLSREVFGEDVLEHYRKVT